MTCLSMNLFLEESGVLMFFDSFFCRKINVVLCLTSVLLEILKLSGSVLYWLCNLNFCAV